MRSMEEEDDMTQSREGWKDVGNCLVFLRKTTGWLTSSDAFLLLLIVHPRFAL